MNRSKLNLILACTMAFTAAPRMSAQQGQSDLSGIWEDNVGGKYLVRQVGNHFYWVDDHRPRYINAFFGTISGSTITGEWADLPGGQLQHSGTLELRIESADRLLKVRSGENFFGGNVFTRGGMGVVGDWEWSFHGAGGNETTTLTINQNGTFTGHGSGGTWQLANAARRMYKLTWKRGSVDTVTVTADGQHLEGSNQTGGHISATRK